jgi:DNA-binding protein HU-beta
MNKEELITAIATETHASKVDSRSFLDAFLKILSESLAKGESVQLVGYFTLNVAQRAARMGRNPKTQEEIKIPASKVVKFSTGKALKELVNKASKVKKK